MDPLKQLRTALSALRDRELVDASTVALVQAVDQLASVPASDLDTIERAAVAAFDEVVPEDAAELTSDDLDLGQLVASAVSVVRAERDRRGTEVGQLVASIRGGDPAPTSPRRPSLGAAAARRRTGSAPAARSGMRALTAGGVTLRTEDAVLDALLASVRELKQGRDAPGTVVRLPADLPTSRQLTGDLETDSALVASAVSAQALTAAGGLCAPVDAAYDQPTWATEGRPLRDALARFDASRGGIRFVRTPSLADAFAGVTVWTELNDQDPGATIGEGPETTGPATKAVWRVDCPTEQEVRIDAIAERLEVSNFRSLTAPEQVGALLRLLHAAHARTAETKLLDRIESEATVVTSAQVLGAARDLLTSVDLAAAAYRSRERMSDASVLRVAMPSWVRALMRTDLARQVPGDSATAVTDEQLDEHFRVRGVAPVWTHDQQPFGPQSAGALEAFPTSVRVLMWPEGSLLFLDGGVLHIGWVRDATLNRTNDVEFFSESFEQLARIGQPVPLAIDVTLAPNGTTSGTVDLTA